MKIVSWNVNGLRAVIKKGNLLDFIEQDDMDVLLLQETKLSTNTNVDPSIFKNRNFYNSYAQKKGYSGTGVIIKKDIKHKVTYGMGVDEFDREGRVINVFIGKLVIINAYFPNSQPHRKRIDYKLAFCAVMQDYIKKFSEDGYQVLLVGDYNVAHNEIDLARPNDNHDSPGFLPEERDCLTKLLASGLTDTFRDKYPDKTDSYTWWSYRTRARERNVGWRIDYQSVNPEFLNKKNIDAIYHNTDVFGSDHCPVTMEVSEK